MEAGPLAVRLWGALVAKSGTIICLDARHANSVLNMMPNKTDRYDARGLAHIVRTGMAFEKARRSLSGLGSPAVDRA